MSEFYCSILGGNQTVKNVFTDEGSVPNWRFQLLFDYSWM